MAISEQLKVQLFCFDECSNYRRTLLPINTSPLVYSNK